VDPQHEKIVRKAECRLNDQEGEKAVGKQHSSAHLRRQVGGAIASGGQSADEVEQIV